MCALREDDRGRSRRGLAAGVIGADGCRDPIAAAGVKPLPLLATRSVPYADGTPSVARPALPGPLAESGVVEERASVPARGYTLVLTGVVHTEPSDAATDGEWGCEGESGRRPPFPLAL